MAASSEFPASTGDHFLEPSISLLSYLDLWPRQLFQSRLINTLWTIHIRLNAYLFILVTCLCVVNIFANTDNIIVFSESILYVVIGGTVTFQWLLLKSKRHQLKRLFELFNQTYQQGQKMIGKKAFEDLWQINYRKVKRFQWIWYMVFTGMYVHWIIFYLSIPLLQQYFNKKWNTNDTLEVDDVVLRFSFQAWYPYNKFISPNYEITLAVETYLLIFLLCVMNAVDFFCNSFMMYLKTHIETLIYAFHSLPADQGRDWFKNQQRYEQQLFQTIFPPGKKWSTNIEAFQIESNLDKEQRLSVDQCLKYHRILSDLFDIFCKEITYAMMGNAIKSLGCICLCAFVSKMLPAGEPKIYNMLEIAIFYCLEFFVYAWNADIVTNKSMELKRAIYDSAWVEAPKEYQIAALIMMIRCGRPMIIPCGPFLKLNLQLAIDLSKFSFSLYTCLTQMKDK